MRAKDLLQLLNEAEDKKKIENYEFEFVGATWDYVAGYTEDPRETGDYKAVATGIGENPKEAAKYAINELIKANWEIPERLKKYIEELDDTGKLVVKLNLVFDVIDNTLNLEEFDDSGDFEEWDYKDSYSPSVEVEYDEEKNQVFVSAVSDDMDKAVDKIIKKLKKDGRITIPSEVEKELKSILSFENALYVIKIYVE